MKKVFATMCNLYPLSLLILIKTIYSGRGWCSDIFFSFSRCESIPRRKKHEAYKCFFYPLYNIYICVCIREAPISTILCDASPIICRQIPISLLHSDSSVTFVVSSRAKIPSTTDACVIRECVIRFVYCINVEG